MIIRAKELVKFLFNLPLLKNPSASVFAYFTFLIDLASTCVLRFGFF